MTTVVPSPQVQAHLRRTNRLLRRLADLLTESERFEDWPEAQQAVAAVDRQLQLARRL